MKRKGFTLIEIAVVVGIIALLATFVIPSLLRARLQANESSAAAALRTTATAEIAYRCGNSMYGTLTQLGLSTAGPPYIDNVLGCASPPCTKSGYNFANTDIGTDTFHISAVPLIAKTTGVRSFCVTEDAVIRQQADGSAIADRTACLALPPSPQ